MLVKAKWNVKDAAGWHKAGEVFNTSQNLGDGVEILDEPKQPEPAVQAEAAPETVNEPAKTAEDKPKTTRRRK